MKKKILAFLLICALVLGLTCGVLSAIFAVKVTASSGTEQARRQRVVDYMYKMCTVEWTPSSTLVYSGCSCGHNYTYEADVIYKGLPYTHKCGSLERMQSYIGDNKVIDVSGFPAEAYNGWDYLLGNDCADAVFWAWSQVTNDLKYLFTSDMLNDPAVKPVGNYTFVNGAGVSNNIAKTAASLTETQAMELYAQVQMGDCMLKPGHARLAASNAVVVRNPNGSINAQESYILIHEQGGQSREYFNTQHSTCAVNVKQTFQELWSAQHIPVTIDAFANDGTAVAPTLSQSGVNADGLPLGILTTTARINYITVEIYDAQGNVVKSNSIYPCKGGQLVQYTIDENELYLSNDAANRLSLSEGQTYKLFVNDRNGRAEVDVQPIREHQGHCICGGDAVGMQGHMSCDTTIQWKPLSEMVVTDGVATPGYYYLTGDTVVSTHLISSGTYCGYKLNNAGTYVFCLNGYKLTADAAWIFTRTVNGTSNLVICDCSENNTGVVENTSTTSANSGAICYTGSSQKVLNTTIFGGTFKANTTRSEGGLFYLKSGSKFTAFGGDFQGKASAAGGVVCAGYSGNTVNIYGGNFHDSEAASGGAIYSKGTLNVLGGTFTGNAATNGGAIYQTGAYLTVGNASITNNTATTAGGGVWFYSNIAMMKLASAKITGNTVNGTADNLHVDGTSKVNTLEVILNPNKAGMGFKVTTTTGGAFGVKLTVEGDVNGGCTKELGTAAGTETVWLNNLYIAGYEDAAVTVQAYYMDGEATRNHGTFQFSMEELIATAETMNLTATQTSALQALKALLNR